MPSGESPSFGFQVSLDYPGVPWASPSLGSFHSLFHSPSNPYPKLENFTTQNLKQKTRELRQYKKINHHLKVMKLTHYLFILVLNLLYSNFCMVYKLFYQPQIHQNKQTTHEKQNLSKTEQSVVIYSQRKIWNTKNSKINFWT